MNANFLLNVGPMPDGKIQPEFVAAACSESGDWLSQNGESIYGTRGGPVAPLQSWGVTTHSKSGNRVYVHVLDPKVGLVRLPSSTTFDPREFLNGKGTAKLLTGAPVRINRPGGSG